MAKDLSKFLSEVVLEVSEDDIDLRLDHFLVDKIFWRSRSDLQGRVRAGLVLLQGKTCKPSARLKRGDVVQVLVRPEDLPDQNPEDIDIHTVYENDQVVVLNKQPGVLVHPTGRHVYDTLMNALHLRYRQAGLETEVHVVHRLDRDTSGVLIFAKNQTAKKALQQTFQDLHPHKEYLALVEGVLSKDSGKIEAPLGRDDQAEIRLKMCVRPDGLASLTRWQVEERFDSHTLVRVQIETGRQHQIRVHMHHIGHPVLADPLYGDPRSIEITQGEPILERQALHAEYLEIEIPCSKRAKHFHAPLHADMKLVINYLREGSKLNRGRDIQSSRWRRA